MKNAENTISEPLALSRFQKNAPRPPIQTLHFPHLIASPPTVTEALLSLKTCFSAQVVVAMLQNILVHAL